MQIRREIQAVLYNRFGRETRVLLVKKLDMRKYASHWRLLKGGIEEGEQEIDALKREIFEEVGLRDVLIEGKINQYEYESEGTLHQVSSYAVKVMTNTPLKVQTEELIDAGWVPRGQALSLLHWQHERNSISKLPVQ